MKNAKKKKKKCGKENSLIQRYYYNKMSQMPCRAKAYKHAQQNPFASGVLQNPKWAATAFTKSCMLTRSKGKPQMHRLWFYSYQKFYCPSTNTNLYLILQFWRLNYSILSVTCYSDCFTNCTIYKYCPVK